MNTVDGERNKMSAAAIAPLTQLAPALIQGTAPIIGGVQQQIIMQQQVQIAYYGALTAYYNSRRRVVVCKCPPKVRHR
jgi:hypothetical protein